MPDLTFEEKFEYVCKEVENGRALRKACPEFMGLEKFYEMLKSNSELAKRYAHACDARADKIFDDMLSISDDNSRDTFIDDKGVERTDNDVIQRSKLMVDTRKWVLAKLAPKKYGDKTEVDHKSSDGSMSPTPIAFSKGSND